MIEPPICDEVCHRQMEDALRASDERVKFLEDLIAGRDRFLVEKGLWWEFMKHLGD